MLFCQLNGVRRGGKITAENNTKYSKLDAKSIAATLHLDKKDVKKSINKLEELGFIEKGSSGTIENGYIFTF
jgi:predicted transcriptional regulator